MRPAPTFALSRRQLLHTAGAAVWLPRLPTLATETAVPASLDALWADFAERDRVTPLETEILREWTEDGLVCRLLRYQVGVFKGAPARVAAFYAFPPGKTSLPALLEMHGGGQSASLDSVVTWAKRGYAALSLNWGGNRLNFGRSTVQYDGPQTDWGKLDATHPPQRNPNNHFAGSLAPDAFTLDPVESPRNSNWYLVLFAARRALGLLQSLPGVDPQRLGVLGHSMGGKLTTNLAGIDPRVKAAVPSCGGGGDILESQTGLPGCSKRKLTPLERACVSDNAFIPRITCPVLWLSPTNDFHAHIDNMAWNWRDLPDARTRFSISPHLNHHHTDEHAVTQRLWFDQHLKGAPFTLPATPAIEVTPGGPGGVPRVTVTPDAARPVKRVDIYYAVDPHGLTRFWRDAGAVRDGEAWTAACPLLALDQPLFVFANAVYDLPESLREGKDLATFAISSRVRSFAPDALRAAGVRATDRVDRMIDDGARGWHDWYRLNWAHPPLWHAATRKLRDPKWRGPDGARLHFEIRSGTENRIVLTFNCNAWGAVQPGHPALDYTVVKPLRASPDWQEVSVRLDELFATDPRVTAPLADWQSVTEFRLSPQGEVARDGVRVKVDGQPWHGPREIRNLRWEGGRYPARIETSAPLRPEELQRSFNDAIRTSLEQEKLNGK